MQQECKEIFQRSRQALFKPPLQEMSQLSTKAGRMSSPAKLLSARCKQAMEQKCQGSDLNKIESTTTIVASAPRQQQGSLSCINKPISDGACPVKPLQERPSSAVKWKEKPQAKLSVSLNALEATIVRAVAQQRDSLNLVNKPISDAQDLPNQAVVTEPQGSCGVE